MKRLASVLLLGPLPLLTACSYTDPRTTAQPTPAPTSAPQAVASAPPAYPQPGVLIQDFKTWYNYTYYHIHLAQEFTGFNADSVAISKVVFLRTLATGKFIPLQVAAALGTPAYKLWRLPPRHNDISQSIQQLATIEQDNYAREGKQLPAYRFTDLQGKTYDPASTKGKIVVLKCWFVGCTACIKEFPELNQLVNDYQGRQDILFISLAMDSKDELTKFLARKPFNYAVVPDQTDYLSEQLKIGMYPTHILVDKTGKISKASSAISDLRPFIAQQMALATR